MFEYSFLFFFQAEDGIRDRSPSRGLGDVYKRQIKDGSLNLENIEAGSKKMKKVLFFLMKVNKQLSLIHI